MAPPARGTTPPCRDPKYSILYATGTYQSTLSRLPAEMQGVDCQPHTRIEITRAPSRRGGRAVSPGVRPARHPVHAARRHGEPALPTHHAPRSRSRLSCTVGAAGALAGFISFELAARGCGGEGGESRAYRRLV
jgi:hypothetical protein